MFAGCNRIIFQFFNIDRWSDQSVDIGEQCQRLVVHIAGLGQSLFRRRGCGVQIAFGQPDFTPNV